AAGECGAAHGRGGLSGDWSRLRGISGARRVAVSGTGARRQPGIAECARIRNIGRAALGTGGGARSRRPKSLVFARQGGIDRSGAQSTEGSMTAVIELSQTIDVIAG